MYNFIFSSDKEKDYWITKKWKYSMQSENQFFKYFFDFIDGNKVLSESENKDARNIFIYGCQDIEDSNNNFNVLISVENLSEKTHDWYKHYNKYGSYGDSKINLYIYNHIANFQVNNNYIAIPTIYVQIDYFKNYYDIIQPTIYTPFNKKKDCLIVSVNKLYGRELDNILKFYTKNLKCDIISDISEISESSCYNSVELLNVFNRYKFIICLENSINDGYITEKIFNAFYSRSIPIYLGPNDRYRYFIKESFIDLRENMINNSKCIKNLSINEELYNKLVGKEKINRNFHNENYKEKTNQYIESYFNKLI